MKELLARLRLRGKCDHDFGNTGAFYTDTQHGFTVTLKQCSKCGATVVAYA